MEKVSYQIYDKTIDNVIRKISKTVWKKTLKQVKINIPFPIKLNSIEIKGEIRRLYYKHRIDR